MRNTKLIVAMLAGCMAVSGAALAQSATPQTAPSPSSTAATHMQSEHDSMKKSDGSMKSEEGGAMKSTHKKHKMKKEGATSEPAKSSTAGM
ncbi:hypothetical protein HBF26_01840 [Luteibacter jiangsuensis]|uniref:Pentapeptide MXKDX repeat protein n=1 Tax=Luteibacter jiangsuensis TaxID=637577 RepID=A0ABX0PZ44_9GAMM|nr:hypothetical protein [Luteibacter jiangsuensis]NID03610.1 hypothetical protein [Luteibacter jiangsuensis]